MAPIIPTAETGYLVATTDIVILDRATWNAVFGSIASRLTTVEGWELNYQQTVDQLTTQALQVISDSITAEIDIGRFELAALRDEFQAVSDAYTDLVSGGVFADGIQFRVQPENLAATNLEDAIHELPKLDDVVAMSIALGG